jgi:hypothetical protein
VIDGHGVESAAAQADAYINSRFESGMKTPERRQAMNLLVVLTTGLLSRFISRLMLPAEGRTMSMTAFRHAFAPLVAGVVLAIIFLSFWVKPVAPTSATTSRRCYESRCLQH